MVGQAFAANLLRAPAFAHGMDQFDAIRVDHSEHRRSGQEDPRPVLMGLQKTKESRPLGEAGKQRPIVARQPAIEGRFPTPFSACNSPKVTTSLGQRWASGCLGMVRSCSSTSENKAVIKSTVIIRLSSQGKDVTESSME